MSKKHSKKIIQEAVEAAIRRDVIAEGPIAFAKSMGSGIKGAAQNVGGNYRANRAKSYMKQFGKKAEKNVEKFAKKTLGQAAKMKGSTNPSVSQTGQKIEDEVADTKARVQSLVQDIDASFPSSVMGGSTQTMAGTPGGSRQGPFYDWLQQQHGISARDFHTPQRQGGMGKSAQDHLLQQYMAQTGQQPPPEAGQAQGQAQPQGKQGKFEKWYAKHYGSIPFKDLGAEGKAKAIAQFNQQRQIKDLKKLRKQKGQAQQPAQAPGQPGLKATIGDMIANKPIVQPQAQAQVPKQPAQPQAQAPQKTSSGGTGRKAVSPPAPSVQHQPKTGADWQRPLSKVTDDPSLHDKKTKPYPGLGDLGGTKEDFKSFTNALNSKDPLARKVWKNLSKGNTELAKKQFQALKARNFKPKGSDTIAGKPKAGAKTGATKQFKNIVNQAAQQAAGTEPIPLQRVKGPKGAQSYTPPTPDQVQPGAQFYTPPTPDQVGTSDTQPYSPQQVQMRVEPEEEPDTSTKAIKKPSSRRKKKKKQESEEPLMTMADFMKRSESDPEQKKLAKQKIDQERRLMDRKGKKRKKGRVLIQDKDEGAKVEDKFVSSDERKDEGY